MIVLQKSVRMDLKSSAGSSTSLFDQCVTQPDDSFMDALANNCRLSRFFSVCWACASMGRPWGAQSAIKDAANEASDFINFIQ